MTTIAASTAVDPETRAALLAYLDALILAEPVQTRLWQLAQITVTQLSVLRTLRDGPQTAGRLAQSVGLSPTSVTRLVDRLERRHLVSRLRESEDRRVVEVRLEPEGEAMLGEVRLLKGSPLHRAVDAMTDTERRRLTAALRRLVELTRAIAAGDEERE